MIDSLPGMAHIEIGDLDLGRHIWGSRIFPLT